MFDPEADMPDRVDSPEDSGVRGGIEPEANGGSRSARTVVRDARIE